MIELKKDDLGESVAQFAERYQSLSPGTREEERTDGPNVILPCYPNFVTEEGRACIVGYRGGWDKKSLFIPEDKFDMKDIIWEIAAGDGWDHSRYSWYRIPETVLDDMI